MSVAYFASLNITIGEIYGMSETSGKLSSVSYLLWHRTLCHVRLYCILCEII